ncbi:MAG TPA: hypothetical protein VIK86_04445 [Candidatus Paceibacterota bacterium]
MHDVCNIYEAKIRLAKELPSFDKVKNNDQIKALVDFLEYLFLIQNPEFEKKYEEYKKENGGVLKLSIDEIRKLHYTEEGREEEREKVKAERKKLILKQYNKGLSIEYIAEINDFDVKYVKDIVSSQ